MTKMPLNIQQLLDTPYELSIEQINAYRTNGFVKLKNVLPLEMVDYMRKTISVEVQRLNTQHVPMEQYAANLKTIITQTGMRYSITSCNV